MALDLSIRQQYKAVIGLEVHAQLLTHTKIFCADATTYGAEPNTHISPISLGHPGTLPKMNRKVIEYAMKMGIACNCEITRENIFARKNYFYPDLPKGYQVSQDKAPICKNGYVWVQPKNASQERKIELNRIHMEEDAGKSIHKKGEVDTLVDFNRAGVPLIEIVTEPCIHSADEAYAFLSEIRRMVRYLEICDGNMEEGSLRCDANISVMPINAKELGDKVEVKNMNSIRNVHRAIEHEVERQILALENGEKIHSETRDFDADSGTTSALRSKENLNDYRYFPEPDLSPIVIDEEWIEKVKAEMPTLARDLRHKFMQEYKLPAMDVEVLTDTKEFAAYFEDLCKHTANYKAASNWMMGPVKSYLNETANTSIKELKIEPNLLAQLIQLIDENKVSHSAASQHIFPALLEGNEQNPMEIATSLNLIQESSSDSIQPIINEVVKDFPEKVKAYKAGKKGLMGMFVGEVMKRSKGKADPKMTNELLKQTLS